MTLAIRPTPPDHPQVQALIAELDAYLMALYPPEDVYIVDLAGLMEPSVTFLGAWDGDVLVGCGAVRLMPAERTLCRTGAAFANKHRRRNAVRTSSSRAGRMT